MNADGLSQREGGLEGEVRGGEDVALPERDQGSGMSTVEIGILGMWACLFGSALVLVINKWRGDIPQDYFVGMVTLHAVMCVLPYMLQKKRNWARYVNAVLTGLGTLMFLGGVRDENTTRLDEVSAWVLMPLSLWTAWAMFSKSGAAWFSRVQIQAKHSTRTPAGDASLVNTNWIIIGAGLALMLVPFPGTGMVGAVLSGGAGVVIAIINMVRKQVGQGVAQLVVACVGTAIFYTLGLSIFAGALLQSMRAH